MNDTVNSAELPKPRNVFKLDRSRRESVDANEEAALQQRNTGLDNLHKKIEESERQEESIAPNGDSIPKAPDRSGSSKKKEKKPTNSKNIIIGGFVVMIVALTASFVVFQKGGVSEIAKEAKSFAASLTGQKPNLTDEFALQIISQAVGNVAPNLPIQDKVVSAALQAALIAEPLKLSIEDRLNLASRSARAQAAELSLTGTDAAQKILTAVYTIGKELGFSDEELLTIGSNSLIEYSTFLMARTAGFSNAESHSVANQVNDSIKGIPINAKDIAFAAFQSARAENLSPEQARIKARAAVVKSLQNMELTDSEKNSIAHGVVFDVIAKDISIKNLTDVAKQQYLTAIQSGKTEDEAIKIMQNAVYESARSTGATVTEARLAANFITPTTNLESDKRTAKITAKILTGKSSNISEANTAVQLAFVAAANSETNNLHEIVISGIHAAINEAQSNGTPIANIKEIVNPIALNIVEQYSDDQTKEWNKTAATAEISATLEATARNFTPEEQAVYVAREVAAAAMEKGDTSNIRSDAPKIARAVSTSLNLPLTEANFNAIQASSSATSIISNDRGSWAIQVAAADMQASISDTTMTPAEKIERVARAARIEAMMQGADPSDQIIAAASFALEEAKRLNLPHDLEQSIVENIITKEAAKKFTGNTDVFITTKTAIAHAKTRHKTEEEQVVAIVNAIYEAGDTLNLPSETTKRKTYVSVLTAAKSLGISQDDAQRMVAKAITMHEVQDLDFSDVEKSMIKARAGAYFKAQQIGMSDAEISRISDRQAQAVAEASGLTKEETAIAMKKIASIDLEKIEPKSGVIDAEQEALLKETARKARTESIRRGETLEEQEVAVVKAVAQELARINGRSEVVQNLSAVRAEAEHKAKILNLPQHEITALGDSAVLNAAKSVSNDPKTIEKAILTEKQDTEVARIEVKAGMQAKKAGLTLAEQEIYIAGEVAEKRAFASGVDTTQIETIKSRAMKSHANKLGLNEKEINNALGNVESTMTLKSARAQQAQDVLMTDYSSKSSQHYETTKFNSLEQQILQMSLAISDLKNQFETSSQRSREQESLAAKIVALELQLGITDKNTKNALKKIQEVAKNTGNQKVINNQTLDLIEEQDQRLCIIEASTGNYSYPAKCEKFYKQTNSTQVASLVEKPTQKVAQKAEKNTTIEQVISAQADKPQDNQKPRLAVKNSVSTGDEIPKTKGESETKIFAQLPVTQEKPQFDSKNLANERDAVCASASNQWKYKTISETSARIENTKGEKFKLVYGTIIPGLGEVIHFQAKKSPKFILFTEGQICR